MAKSFETSARHAQIVRADVSRSGLIANDEKSVWVPTQNITWLGLTWDGRDGTLAIASHRIEKLISTLNRVLTNTEHTRFRQSTSQRCRPDYINRTGDGKPSPDHVTTLSDVHSLRSRMGHTF